MEPLDEVSDAVVGDEGCAADLIVQIDDASLVGLVAETKRSSHRRNALISIGWVAVMVLLLWYGSTIGIARAVLRGSTVGGVFLLLVMMIGFQV